MAERLGVSRQTLSGYLHDGKIEPHSIVGQGRHARIDMHRAIADLRVNLDPDQMVRANRKVEL